jgi:transposase
MAGRRGRAKAAVAVAYSISIIAYHVLTEGADYRDLGGNYFDERNRQEVERQLVHRQEGLGYTVSLHLAT